ASAFGCSSLSSSATTVVVRSPFDGGTLSATSQTICSGQTPSNITYSIPPTGGSNLEFQWYRRTGSHTAPTGPFSIGSWTAVGSPSSSPTLPGTTIGPLTATTTFALRVRDIGSPACFDNWAGNAHVVNVNPRPTGVISGSATICQSESANLTLTFTGTGPWSGTLSDGTPFSSAISPLSLSVSPPTTTTYTISTLSDAFCSATGSELSGSATVTIINPCLFTWTGSVDNEWSNPLNWSPAVVPNACSYNVIIPAVTNHPHIGNATYTVGDITLHNNALIQFTHANGKLNICSDVYSGTGAGSSLTGLGRAVLIGSSPQTLNGKLHADVLQLDNSTGAIVHTSAQLNIYRYLELKSGSLTTNGNVIFKSPDENNCAMLDDFSAGFSGTINGTIQAERGYSAASAASLYSQHYFSSPINSIPVSQLAPPAGANGVFVTPTADCDETQLEGNSNYGNVFEYDESNVIYCNLEAWRVRSAGNTENGRGYSVKQGAGVLTLSGVT
ncbi:MAG: hypothetical protein RMJ53_06440, partial [Chitinophagales bacterium]|nr:hypothetical protein [Chitinophagales bacterium]